MTGNALIWLLIGIMATIAFLLTYALHMTLEPAPIEVALVRVLAFLAAWFVCQHRLPAVAFMAVTGAQLAALAQVAGILTYVAVAASPNPFADLRLYQLDAALGFNWPTWYFAAKRQSWLWDSLQVAYASVPFQVAALVCYFGVKDKFRVTELVLAAVLALIVVAAGVALFPANGSLTFGQVGVDVPWMRDITALHARSMTVIPDPKGLVSFPSFYAALGVLFVFACRGTRLFRPMLALNTALILAVVPVAGHYLVDAVSGVVLGFVALVAAQYLLASASDEASAATQRIDQRVSQIARSRYPT